MENSLLFFYFIWGGFLLYFVITFIKDKYKWKSLTFTVSLIICGYLLSLSFPTPGGVWLILTILAAMALNIVLFVCFGFINLYLIEKYFKSVVKLMKYSSPTDLINKLIEDHHKYQWYALHIPAEDTLEIGINLDKKDPVIGKKVLIKTLTGRYLNFVPEYITVIKVMESNIICPFQEFYEFNIQTKTLINSYIASITLGVEKSWLISNMTKNSKHDPTL
ncbi:hypothetical protein [Pseudocitrobacter corydidari]|uniref:Sporulation protein n=1 Tax=Pseudocitrobacter corydidari TaxID=2891570 RepID=A0ABY3S346_9ENTR|nr:hypothetical protein [Pseudocitrobacter corydidari]UGS40989.1 hypothetical protein G163CM_16900 [Pseudocitrobacter corydidari]